MIPAAKNLSRHNCLKYLIILVVWTVVLLFILKVYNNDNRYFDRNNDIKRKTKITDLLKSRKILESFNPLNLESDELQLFGNSTAPNQEELIAAIESEHPSIAFRYWVTHKGKPLQKSKNCAKFPSVLKLKYHNKYWQTFVKENITIQLYNAYYDTRPTLTGGPLVRLLVMSNEYVFTNQTIYCQLWYDDSLKPGITKAFNFRSIWNLKWGRPKGHLFPFLIDCPLPQSKQGPTPQSTQGPRVPKVVSLVAKECDTATNTLRIHYDMPKYAFPNNTESKFAICIKGIDYPYSDISARLVEWIELQFILGASKIFFYQLEMHPNVTKVLEYYRQRGLVDLRPITLADGEPNLDNLQHYLLGKQLMKKRLNELIPYNDCFYRNIYRYDYISVQDIDEVLMPLGNLTTWSELMEIYEHYRPKGCAKGHASYCFRNVYFSNPNNSAPYASDIPQFMHMLQHVERNTTHMKAGINTKCFHRTDQVITLHNHFSRSWLKVCPWKTLDANVAQLQHYRERPHLKSTVIDMSVWRYKDELLQRSLDALRDMGFLHKAIPGEDFS